MSKKLKGYDVVVVFGAPVFRYYPYEAGNYLPHGTSLWQVTDDPSEAARAPVGEALLSDPALAINELNILFQNYTANRQLPESMPAAAAPKESDPLTAASLFAALNGAKKEHTVLVEESPSNLADLHKQWKITEPLSFFTMASGGLGFGLPAAVGVALAERHTGRNRPVVAVIGDGSLQYCIQSLWTAAQQKLQLLVVVPENREYAILKAFAKLQKTPDVPGLDVLGLDIMQLAVGYGCRAVRATTVAEVTVAVKEAFQQQGPTVMVVPINNEVPPLI